MFLATMSGNRVHDSNGTTTRDGLMGEAGGSAMSMIPSHAWRRHLSTTSSEGERLMLEALVKSSRGGRRTVLQYIKMLLVVASVHQDVAGRGAAGGCSHRSRGL